MIEFLKSLGEDELRLLATFISLIIAGTLAAFLGYRKGKPTSAAAAAAVEAASTCRAREDLGPAIEHMAEKLNEIERVQRQQDVTLARLDERTRRD